MVGFFRLFAILVGAGVLALAALNSYVGVGALEEILYRVPGYYYISENPGHCGMAAAVFIIAALAMPWDDQGVGRNGR